MKDIHSIYDDDMYYFTFGPVFYAINLLYFPLTMI